jgi:hypothetical protein
MTGQSALRDLQHYCPEVVRNLRLALNVGVTAQRLKRLCKGERAEYLRAAIDYMAANPKAGVVRWLPGEEYDWVEKEQPQKGKTP